jgi:crotonobetainyl-CoA:carnitine CoA-transferase CaiB-like acyl-CoA transferase
MRTGRGLQAEAALAYTGTLLQSAWLHAPTAEEQLHRMGIGAHRLVSISELMHDPWVVSHGLSITRPHDTGEEITSVGPAARMSRTPVRPGRPAASPGGDAADVLRELGREPQLEELLSRGVLAIEMPSTGTSARTARS